MAVTSPEPPRPPLVPAGLDLTFVTPGLAIGARLPERGEARLARELELRRVVDVRLEMRDDEEELRRNGARLLHLPTRDHHPLSPAALDLGVRWVLEALSSHERVLIHCQHGIGRSALLTACVLVREGRSAGAALELCKSARPRVSPSQAQLEALSSFADSTRPGGAVSSASLRELAAIAYARRPAE